MLFGAVYFGVTVRLLDFNPVNHLVVGELWTKALFFTVTAMAMMTATGLYQRGLRDEPRGILLRLGVAFGGTLVLVLIALQFEPSLSIGRAAFVIAFTSSLLGIVIFRILLHHYLGNTFFRRRVVVLGTGRAASEIEHLRRKSDWQESELIGFISLEGEKTVVPAEKCIQLDVPLIEFANRHRIDEIVVGADEELGKVPVREVLECKMNGIDIIDVMSFFEQRTGTIRLDALRPHDIIFADGFIQAVLKGYVHRGFDITVAAVGLLLTAPIMLFAALAILVDSAGRGGVLYRQVRAGRKGKPFTILKFRSMRPDAESNGKAQWASANDMRVTRVGAFMRKTRIDELPQLINVLKGEMSFVGPRPERPEFIEELAEQIPYYHLREWVNPGITGWAQICFPYGASAEDARQKLQYDLYYIKNYSLFLDIMILIQTAQVVLWRKGGR